MASATLSGAAQAPASLHPFDRRVAEMAVHKDDINRMILDYLTSMAHTKAALSFCREAKLDLQQSQEFVECRASIMMLILEGIVMKAISLLNEWDPELLDVDEELHFDLLQLHLIELIRMCQGKDPTPAVEFATNNLAPRAANNPKFLKKLEQTMALIIFPHNSLQPELAALLSPDLRRTVAYKVNMAMLRRRYPAHAEPSLLWLMRTRIHAEDVCRSKGRNLPEKIDLGMNPEGQDKPEPMDT